jgi:putative transposase
MFGRRRLITMARRRHTPEQIIRKLREADRLLAEGAEVADVARHLEVSEQTYHRWRNQFGGMKADDARRLKDLERENARLKRIVADKELEIDALREISRGNWARRVDAERSSCCRTASAFRSDGRMRSWASTAPPSGTRRPIRTRTGTCGCGYAGSRRPTSGGATGAPMLCCAARGTS